MAIEFSQSTLGGGYINAASGEVTGNFVSLKVVNDAVISAITFDQRRDATYAGAAILQGITLTAGDFHPVPFTSITLTSGVIYYVGVAD